MSIVVVGTVAFDTVETPFGRGENVLGGLGYLFFHIGQLLYRCIAGCGCRAWLQRFQLYRHFRYGADARCCRGAAQRMQGCWS